jgi:hypothetical protein
MKRYLCFDSALNEVYTLMLLQQEYKSHISLFKDTSDEGIWDVAPWLFEIGDSDFYKKWEDPNISLQRCLIFETAMNLKEIKEHLQQFIYKKIEGITHFNRFWDAKVLKQQIERFDAKELTAFFEDIDAVYMKEESGQQFLKIIIDKRSRHAKQLIHETDLFQANTPLGEEKGEADKAIDKPKTRKFFTE